MSTSNKWNLVNVLYGGTDPFAFFQGSENDIDFQGWGSSHPYLSEAIERICPKIIIEVGVWKGASVIFMAEQLRRLALDAVIIAIDTWRGSSEHWLNRKSWESLRVSGGIVHLQETFMANILARGLEDFVLPLPLDSINAFQVCKKLQIRPDLVHIDAGHDYESVSTDLRIWWSLLGQGGAMICDDYSVDELGKPKGWPGVVKAIGEHLDTTDSRIGFKHQDNKCYIRKGTGDEGTR